MNIVEEGSGSEPVDSSSPIMKLWGRIKDLSVYGKRLIEPTQNSWREREILNGFETTYRTIFVPYEFGEDVEELESSENNGVSVLVRNIRDVRTIQIPDDKPFISFLVRIGDDMDPTIIIDRKSIDNLKTAQQTGVSLTEVDFCLANMIIENELHHEEPAVYLLDKAPPDFINRLIESLESRRLELVEDDSSSAH